MNAFDTLGRRNTEAPISLIRKGELSDYAPTTPMSADDAALLMRKAIGNVTLAADIMRTLADSDIDVCKPGAIGRAAPEIACVLETQKGAIRRMMESAA